MKILATSDIHGNKTLIYFIHDIVKKENVDALIIAGDIAPKGFYQLFMVQESIKHFPIPLRKSPKVIAEGDFLEEGLRFDISSGFRLKNRTDILKGNEQQIKTKLDLLGFVEFSEDNCNLSTIKLKQIEKLSGICKLLKTIDIPVYMLIGNDDHILKRNWEGILNDYRIFNLNSRAHILENIKIVGFQYVLPTPWNTNNELPEDELAKRLKHIERQIDRRTIFVTHGPPKGVLDRLANGLLAGSESIFKLVRDKQPVFHIFGHIHEAFGDAKIDDTICCNASCLWSDWLLRGYIIDTQIRCIKKIEKAISLSDFRRIFDKHLANRSSYLAESEVTDGKQDKFF